MSSKPKRAAAVLLADLRAPLPGWKDPVAFGVGWDEAIYAVARNTDEPLTENRGLGIFPKSKLEQRADYLVLRTLNGQVQTLEHCDESLVVSFVQPFPGRGLLVGGRCRWHATGAEKTALVLDWSGRELGRFTVGDGIQVCVSPGT